MSEGITIKGFERQNNKLVSMIVGEVKTGKYGENGSRGSDKMAGRDYNNNRDRETNRNFKYILWFLCGISGFQYCPLPKLHSKQPDLMSQASGFLTILSREWQNIG